MFLLYADIVAAYVSCMSECRYSGISKGIINIPIAIMPSRDYYRA